MPWAQRLQRCAKINSAEQRLACYDQLAQRQAAKGLKQAAKPQKQQKQQKQRTASATEQFGIEHKSRADEDLNKITVAIKSRRKGPYGKWVITLENGQVWKQTDAGGFFGWDEDDTYFIERGAFNSFFFGREGVNRRFRVQRVK